MSVNSVLQHMERVLSNCGDPVRLSTLPQDPVRSELRGNLSILIRQTVILKENKCIEIAPPTPLREDDRGDGYIINRVRLSESIINDYSKGDPYRDDELLNVIKEKEGLFAYYE